jgi:WD40 repeat protein
LKPSDQVRDRNTLSIPAVANGGRSLGGLDSPVLEPDRVAAGTSNGGVSLWDLSSPGPARQLDQLQSGANQVTNQVTSIGFSPDGRTLAASGGDAGTFRLWDVTQWWQVAPLALWGSRT